MKKLAFILAVLLAVGMVMAQDKVDVAKISAPATGTAVAASSDSVVCATDTGCVVKQATASNLNATVVGTGTFAMQPQGFGSSGNVEYENCDSSATYDTNTNGKTQLVALTMSQVIRVCGLILTQASTSTVNVSFGSGTGANCGSTYTAKTPAFQLAGPAAAAFQGLVLPNSQIPYFQTASGEELCISTSAGVSVQAMVVYSKR